MKSREKAGNEMREEGNESNFVIALSWAFVMIFSTTLKLVKNVMSSYGD